MISISGNKDIDREILMKCSDESFVKLSNINRYFRNDVCDDVLIERRLRKTHPETLKYKKGAWVKYFLVTIHYIDKLKKDFNYIYKGRDPRLQYYILTLATDEYQVKNLIQTGLDLCVELDRVLMAAVYNGNFEIVKYVVEQGANVNYWQGDPLFYAEKRGHAKIVEYLKENGAWCSQKISLVDFISKENDF